MTQPKVMLITGASGGIAGSSSTTPTTPASTTF